MRQLPPSLVCHDRIEFPQWSYGLGLIRNGCQGRYKQTFMVFQEVFQKTINLAVGFECWIMPFSIRHRHPVRISKDTIDRDGVIQGLPPLYWVFRTA